MGGRVLEGRRIIVATGSRPRIPEIKGLHETFRRGLAFTNEEFFSAGRMPSSVVFIGGGAVAVELAQALARLGVKTWIIYRSALLKYEEDASRFVEELLREEFLPSFPSLGEATRLAALAFYTDSSKLSC